jgi:NADH dehydrogenase
MTAPTLSRLDGKIVTLFGGGGFLGRHTAQAFMQAGARVRIVQRHPEKAFNVRALGNLGQTQFVSADAAVAEHALKAAIGSDIVINLVGILKGDFDRVHVDAARNIARAAHAAGARLIHISALGAGDDSPSAYGRSKAAGEAAVRAVVPEATVLRPSIMFGQQDRFINRFAGMIRMAPIVPVVAPDTKFQPLFVGDMADAITAAVGSDNARAATLEIGGGRILSMRQLLEWIAGQINYAPVFVDVPDAAAAALASATGWLPGAPITKDQWLMLGRDNVVNGVNGLDVLGIAETPLESVAEGWLDIYRRHGRFTGKAAHAA